MSIMLNAVSRRFAGKTAVDAVTLDIPDGTFFAVVGPSGCGKSTLLRLIAGLERPDEGTIALDGIPVAGPGMHLPAEERGVGVVFQSYALWPHMTVARNVAFPLETAGLSGKNARQAAAQFLKTVALTEYSSRRPADLSGGQRQRVALARCLAQGARIILMDEPLANLDPHLRNAMEEELAAFHLKSEATTFYITHDQHEAMALAGMIAVMWEGRILQSGRPEDVYARPSCARVASFIGKGAILPVSVTAVAGQRACVQLGSVKIEVACAAASALGQGQLLVRPEQVSSTGNGVPARIVSRIFRGDHWAAVVQLDGGDCHLPIRLSHKPNPGDRLHLQINDGWLLPED
jgi:iron(III) transport system ATP-binding protein